MRIVHEVLNRAQITLSGDPYSPPKGVSSKPTGFHVEILMCIPEKGLAPKDNIHIEGDAKYVLDMLKRTVRSLEASGAIYVQEGRLEEGWEELPSSGV